ncbi:hypothetical protein WT24_06875 [Burkholderia sp. MSMB1078WGS]|nr:hypothetical protein WT24_06875 [Burkholderia sp. MSMB1078WGS]
MMRLAVLSGDRRDAPALVGISERRQTDSAMNGFVPPVRATDLSVAAVRPGTWWRRNAENPRFTPFTPVCIPSQWKLA